MAEIVYEIPEEEKNIEQLLIPEPKNEPIVGVIDTQFDKSVYFSEWVEYHKCISEDIDLQTGDFSMERQYHQLLLMALLLIQIYKITVDVLEFGILVLLQQDVLAHLQY